ncbi:MAG: prolipoprotein diacylglyceryl transferase [Planctomycetia bacterium]|nr:prolipoprotein diacylglyceryl transferase [Planctomycetia bacterium]
MRSILFHIPGRIGAVPLFGWGLLLAIWALAAVVAVTLSLRHHGPGRTLGQLGPLVAGSGAFILWGLPALDDGAGVAIRGYGAMLLAAAAAGTWLSVVRGRRMGFDADTILALGVEVFLWGLVGARLFYVIEYHEQFFPPGRPLLAGIPAVLNLAAGGLVVFGSLPTAAAATWWFARRRRLSLPRLADCIAPGLLLGLALGRVGCFLNGCCFGGPCDLPWGVRFPPESPPWLDQVARGLVPPTPGAGPTPWSLPAHPAQLYAAIDAALLAWLAVCFTPRARRDGEVFALILTLHPVSRILLEMIRIDEAPALGTPLSISQLVSVVLLVCAAVAWAVLWRQPPRPVTGS